MALVHTIPTTDATVPPAVQASGNGTLPSDWLRSFDGTTAVAYKLFAPVAHAMQAMILAALADGIRLTTTGRYRSYAQQESLFLQRYTPGPFDPAVHRTSPSIVRRVWNGREWYLKRGMAMAATPGTSNHGWGIADDICEAGPNGEKISIRDGALAWLRDNAADFGFALDIHEEPWHWHWYRPGAVSELTQRTVDVLDAVGVRVPDLATFGFTAPPPTPPPAPPEEDDMPLSDEDVQRIAEAVWTREIVDPYNWNRRHKMQDIGAMAAMGVLHETLPHPSRVGVSVKFANLIRSMAQKLGV